MHSVIPFFFFFFNSPQNRIHCYYFFVAFLKLLGLNAVWIRMLQAVSPNKVNFVQWLYSWASSHLSQSFQWKIVYPSCIQVPDPGTWPRTQLSSQVLNFNQHPVEPQRWKVPVTFDACALFGHLYQSFLDSTAITLNFHMLCMCRETLVTRTAEQIASILIGLCISTARIVTRLWRVPEASLCSAALEIRAGSICKRPRSLFTSVIDQIAPNRKYNAHSIQ